MRSVVLTVSAFALVVAACGTTGVDGSESAAPAASPPTLAARSAPPTTFAATGGGEALGEGPVSAGESTTTAPPVIVEGPPAPDYTLALGVGGGEFTLSEEQKPVYMVFWAEW